MQTVANQTEKIKAALAMVRAVADAIKALGSIPSGHLYAQVMGAMGLDEYEWVIRQLVGAGLVKQAQSGLLTWVEPTESAVSS